MTVHSPSVRELSRRALLRHALVRLSMGWAGLSLSAGILPGRGYSVSHSPASNFTASDSAASNSTAAPAPPPLLGADSNGLRLPPGASSRVVARSGREPPGTAGYRWHAAPDGGAVFPAPDGGWVYVSNSELPSAAGGAGALRFDSGGKVSAAYSILERTSRNCSGGPTPWGSWLSCEEVWRGRVWECDPFGKRKAVARPALGLFSHEGAAVDPATNRVYLTEDKQDGLLYRFTPAGVEGGDGGDGGVDRSGAANLSSGLLEALRVIPAGDGKVEWLPVPDPAARLFPTRKQVSGAMRFIRGEGIWFHEGALYFASTGDHLIWRLDPAKENIRVFYDAESHSPRRLINPDNVTVAPDGTVLVCEDGGGMRIVAISPQGSVYPLLQVTGHSNSEVAGAALDPSGTRLYFSSQRGATNRPEDGVTYEVSGLEWGEGRFK